MGTHVSFIFRGYDPYFDGLKPSCFMVLWQKQQPGCNQLGFPHQHGKTIAFTSSGGRLKRLFFSEKRCCGDFHQRKDVI